MPNHLAGQTSPYLLQHVDNPVDWYPWTDEPLVLAMACDRPILLSVGYSACGRAVAWVCRAVTCSPPVERLGALEELLGPPPSGPR